MATCNAKTRNGTPCKKTAMENGRCRHHGGLSTGAPKGNTHAMKHGIYSAVLTDNEKELFGNGKLRDLLSFAYIQHLRAVEANQPEIAERLLGRIANIEKTITDTISDETETESDMFAEQMKEATKGAWD